MKWRTQPEPPLLEQMAARGPLVLCLSCGTYRTTVPGLLRARPVEVIEAHDDARGQPCEGSGAPWDELREGLAGTVPAVWE